uniref:Uncharacterized protein n=1 Tax=Chlamydomonas euryale TaxID=1486919 RepID=A0A7R9Z2E2_9CHLO|mmetsp:Transcript_40903/g.122135  ORF Transcript_40903/g.122135 Transcript_40903/m.122135 type:complete len:103 (+) Transcript_40903:31-339(+)
MHAGGLWETSEDMWLPAGLMHACLGCLAMRTLACGRPLVARMHAGGCGLAMYMQARGQWIATHMHGTMVMPPVCMQPSRYVMHTRAALVGGRTPGRRREQAG